MLMNRLMAAVHSSPFRTAAAFTSALTVCFVLLSAFIYWQTAVAETFRIESFIARQAGLIAGAPPEAILWAVQSHVATDLHRVTLAALFDREGRRIYGNIERIPADLPPDGKTHWVHVVANDVGVYRSGEVIAVAHQLPGGGFLVIGRNIEELTNLRRVVARALTLGVIPAALLALGAGAWMGQRTWRRVRSWQRILDRVRDGHLSERLPMRGSSDDLECLGASVNQMLEEIERLLSELHNVGNSIAHDLRTPLARVRAQLERTRHGTNSREELELTIDKAIVGIDQSIQITTALLRIAEIEGSRRRDGFGPVDLVEIAKEVADFYGPAAELKRISLQLDLAGYAGLFGDRDLLFEAVANLVDNAIKYTPEGGYVGLQVCDCPSGPLLRVRDTGPGIPVSAHDQVFKRFFRFDRSRNTPGTGLGLSLVAAIARLHGYALTLEDGNPGCIFLMACAPAAQQSTADPARLQVADLTA